MLNANTEILANNNPFTPTISLNWESSKEQILYWKQPKRLQGEYLFRSNEHILGTLQYDEQNFIRKAIATTDQGEWFFKYTHFSFPKVTIQLKNHIIAQTIMETNWGWRGTLILPDEGRYIWKSIDESENEFRFSTSTGHPLVISRPHFGFLKLEAEVEMDSAIFRNPHLPLLTMLGWFLVLIRLR